eukprot:scaffold916_cov516-Prasinococcus_capsulatus_cf.AAC.29
MAWWSLGSSPSANHIRHPLGASGDGGPSRLRTGACACRYNLGGLILRIIIARRHDSSCHWAEYWRPRWKRGAPTPHMSI